MSAPVVFIPPTEHQRKVMARRPVVFAVVTLRFYDPHFHVIKATSSEAAEAARLDYCEYLYSAYAQS
jgi:hypothetical protein